VPFIHRAKVGARAWRYVAKIQKVEQGLRSVCSSTKKEAKGAAPCPKT